MLLSCCGIATYRIFKGLTAQAKPVDKTVSDLVSLMKDHQNPKRNLIAERFLFNSRNRKLNKNMSNFIAGLHCLFIISKSGTCAKRKSEREWTCECIQGEQANNNFPDSIVQGNTVPRYVLSSINNVFIVKTKDTLKKCVKRKPPK